jgi:tRNA A22 N-methylase
VKSALGGVGVVGVGVGGTLIHKIIKGIEKKEGNFELEPGKREWKIRVLAALGRV